MKLFVQVKKKVWHIKWYTAYGSSIVLELQCEEAE